MDLNLPLPDLPPDMAKSIKDLEDLGDKLFPRNPNTKFILCPKCQGKECVYCYGCGSIEVPLDYVEKKIITL